jgi:hyperosmotically inducible protein
VKTRLLTVALIALTFVAPCAAAAQGAQGSDAQLADLVAEAVQHCAHFTIFDDVSISVINHQVTIGGRVTLRSKRDEIAALISKIDGVRSVTNAITVLPASSTDDDLRQRIARAIYSHPSFRRYASMGCPPIHIVVENGRVTLTGQVADETERVLAFSLAHVSGVLDARNQLRLDGRGNPPRGLVF